MSVKRFYWDTPSEYGHAEEHPEGELVWWTDYAKLEAENARLKAEVERLRKAGDELLREWSSGDETDGRNFKKGLVLWNAAKEGKPQS